MRRWKLNSTSSPRIHELNMTPQYRNWYSSSEPLFKFRFASLPYANIASSLRRTVFRTYRAIDFFHLFMYILAYFMLEKIVSGAIDRASNAASSPVIDQRIKITNRRRIKAHFRIRIIWMLTLKYWIFKFESNLL